MDWDKFMWFGLGWAVSAIFYWMVQRLNMADKRVTVYPPEGGEGITANPEYLEHYLKMGWSESPKAKEKPKDGKTDRKIK